MDLIRMYAAFWLVWCGYDVYKLLEAKTHETAKEKIQKMTEKMEQFESACRLFSAGFVLRLAYVILVFCFAFDLIGLLLAYAHAPLRAHELAVLCAAGVFVVFDQVASGIRLVKTMSKAFRFEKPVPVLARYMHMMRPERKWTRYPASCGKFIAALYFALWAFAG
ncbi:MAG: hypothetical protein IJ631_04135 [Schwartzia sp.]|nr:hypothetical protein [Schwartzia sp. (in: firmicutes)]